MRNFFIFNFLGIALMFIGLCMVLISHSAGPFLIFIGLFSVLVGYKYGFDAHK